MNHKKIYENIIKKAESENRNKTKDGVLYERHHIIPKSCGGLNDKTNLVLLTPKEHYICHRLLVFIYENTKHKNKMYYAMWCMINGNGNQNRYSPSSKIYEKLRKEIDSIRPLERYSNRKPVTQYGLNGEFIKNFKSVKEASSATGINRSSIEMCAINKSKTGMGYIWKYNTDNEIDIDPIVKDKSGRKTGGTPWNKGLKMLIGCGSHTKKIYQYDLSGGFLNEWECISIVVNELKINRGAIENCALNKTKSSGGFIWSYNYKDFIEPIPHKKPGRKIGSIPWNKKK